MNQDSSTEQLASWLRREVGRLAPGERLPSTRKLTASHQVSPVTVSRALALLAGEGVVVTQPGVGTFVAPRLAGRDSGDTSWQALTLGERPVSAEGISPLTDPQASSELISLGSGYPHPSLMPGQALSAALARAARSPGAWDRPPTAGWRACGRGSPAPRARAPATPVT